MIFGVDTKSPGAARQKRWRAASRKYSGCVSLTAARAMSGSSAAQLTARCGRHSLCSRERDGHLRTESSDALPAATAANFAFCFTPG